MKKFLIIICTICITNVGLANDAVQLREGILLDIASDSLVVMLPKGGVASVDIATGKHRWSTVDADKPLAISNGQMVSQKQNNKKAVLTLVYQQISNGEVLNSIDIELPNDVMVSVTDGAAHQFQIKVDPQSTNNQLLWSFQGGQAQGAAPELAFLNNAAVSRSQKNATLKQGVIELDFSRNQAKLVNKTVTRPVAKARTEVSLLPAVQGRKFLSVDGQHVMASVRVNDDKLIRYNWQIFSLNGDLLDDLEAKYSFVPFVVKDNLMLMIEPEIGRLEAGKLVRNSPILKAVNLQNGSLSWQLPIRSIKYFGQLPH